MSFGEIFWLSILIFFFVPTIISWIIIAVGAIINRQGSDKEMPREYDPYGF